MDTETMMIVAPPASGRILTVRFSAEFSAHSTELLASCLDGTERRFTFYQGKYHLSDSKDLPEALKTQGKGSWSQPVIVHPKAP